MKFLILSPRLLAFFVLLTSLILPLNVTAQQTLDAPKATWITHPTAEGKAYGVFHFRKSLELSSVPDQFNIHVSADNRYRFFVNGASVAAGPQRSDIMHWRYEELDISPYLHEGNNIIAAVVWNWGDLKPVAQHSYQTGFLLRGMSERESVLNTGVTPWKVIQNEAYQAIAISYEKAGGYYAAPPGELVDGRAYPWGWETEIYDDTAWQNAVEVRAERIQKYFRGSHPYGEAGGWQLMPRSIPMMDEHLVRFDSVRRTVNIETDGAFLQNKGDLVIPANSKTTLLLDQDHLTNAYMMLETSKGLGSKITMIYAEALKDANGIKGHRDKIDGKTITGVEDVFYADGGDHRKYQTLWFRTYRYVEVTIETADEALQIHDVQGLYTAYPYKLNASFKSDLPWLKDMWKINWRVLQLCAWETYFDTPYYEQLQYVGDTRLQSLMSLYMSGDDRLMRQAITHFDYSRIPEGITASRYPSDLGQYIPTFSLIWVAMAHDYWMHRDDTDYVRGLMPGVRSVLGWFEGKVDETGLVGPLPWWPFVDWATDWYEGTAPGGRDGHSVIVTLQYIYALQRAAELEKTFGQADQAKIYQAQADQLLENVRKLAWDKERGLFKDSLEEKTFSQQANTLAILTGAVPEKDKKSVMGKILDDKSLTQATYYFSFYVLEALREADLSERYIEQLAPWQDMLALGLTTTPEQPAPSRTDSHAWAAHPNYGLLATVLGIRPAEPGFKSVNIKPSLGTLNEAEGTMPHPMGDIHVSLMRDGENGVKAEVTLPEGLNGVFDWNGKTKNLKSGKQEFSF